MVAVPYSGVEHAGALDLSGEVSDEELVEQLRGGDESAFSEIFERYHTAMVSLAVVYVRSWSVAEEVAQDTWIAVLNGIDRFEGRSSLKTWIYRILINRAMTRGKRENRCLAFSVVWEQAGRSGEAAVDPAHFISASGATCGAWAAAPQPWEDQPEERLLSGEVRERLQDAIEQLPLSQRTVITLRDVEGWSSSEVCNTLDISETNQRVLLHRARAKVRRALEGYLEHV
jgi:RNA polymerase sigma-70 factor (ECF subfamily)